jgi:hypothetical protein
MMRTTSIVLGVALAACALGLATSARADLSATAYNSGTDQFTYGTSVSAAVLTGSTYAGIGSQVVGAENGGAYLGSRMRILDGVNPGPDTTVSMAWRNRTTMELDGRGSFVQNLGTVQCYTNGTGSPGTLGSALALDAYNMGSDVVSLGGINGTYALEMTYTPTALIYYYPSYTEAFLDQQNRLYLGWFTTSSTLGTLANYDEWVNAVDGNSTTGSKAVAYYKGSYLSFTTSHADFNLNDYLGSFGSDIDNHTVWAIVDHNSAFGSIPEPGTICLLVLGAATLIRRRRNQKN